jgi:hypothetical protein
LLLRAFGGERKKEETKRLARKPPTPGAMQRRQAVEGGFCRNS